MLKRFKFAAGFAFQSGRKPNVSFCHSFQRLLGSSAAGYRANTTGALTSVGAGGWCWSSSSYAAGNINAGSLNFNTSNVNPLNNNNRANGFSVRCVQHLLRGCFLFGGEK